MYEADKAKLCRKIFTFFILLINATIIFVSAYLFNLETIADVVGNSTAAMELARSAINVNFAEMKQWSRSSYWHLYLILLTLLQTFIVGLHRYHNPEQRWQSQRTMAAKMLKIIWKFRTYTDLFDKRKMSRGQVADDVLEMKLKEWRGSAGNGTEFVSTTPNHHLRGKVFCHDQYAVLSEKTSDLRSRLIKRQLATCSLNQAPRVKLHELTEEIKFQKESAQDLRDDDLRRCQSCSRCWYTFLHCLFNCCGGYINTADEWDKIIEHTQWSAYSVYNRSGSMRRENLEDDHFSPTTGREYVKHRLIPALRFFEGRMPKYLCQQTCSTYVIAIMTMLASFAAVFVIPPSSQFWVAIIVACITCLSGFEKFYDAANKLTRYKTTTAELKKLLAFWEGLGRLKENKSYNNSRVVQLGEEIICNVSLSCDISRSHLDQ